jgi:phosphoglucosamine mutase
MGKLFGTDGIRGMANVYPMTPELAMKVGKAVAKVLSGKVPGRKPKVVIGKDTRLSGYMLEYALASGLLSMGANVLLIGPIPTPGIAHLTKSMNCDFGIMLTASHNAAHDNGIKIFTHDGFKLPDEMENEIEDWILNKDINSEHISGDALGKAYKVEEGKGRYIEFAKASINYERLEGLKLVIDCANGAAYASAPYVFVELGATIKVINSRPNGLNINDNCGALHVEQLREKVLSEKADVGIALDGDADRLIVIDETGAIVDGDKVMFILAKYLMSKGKLKKNSIVATHYSNLGLAKAMESIGGSLVRADCGDRYVLEEMRKNDYNLGGEKSGHVIFLDHVTTGDGIITALNLLSVMKSSSRKMSELGSEMKLYPQVLSGVKVKEKKDLNLIPGYSDKIKEIEDKLGSSGRVYVRYSGTGAKCRIMIEGPDQAQIEEFAKEIANVIEKDIGA